MSVIVDSLLANTKMSGFTPFVDGQSAIFPFLGDHEFRPLLAGYRALLARNRGLLAGNRALLTRYRAVLAGYRAWICMAGRYWGVCVCACMGVRVCVCVCVFGVAGRHGVFLTKCSAVSMESRTLLIGYRALLAEDRALLADVYGHFACHRV